MWRPPGPGLMILLGGACVLMGIGPCSCVGYLGLSLFSVPRSSQGPWPHIIGAGVMLLIFGAYVFYCHGWRLWNRVWDRWTSHCCTQCGYDLRAHQEGNRCPECGAVHESPLKKMD